MSIDAGEMLWCFMRTNASEFFGDASSGNVQPHILPGLGSYQRTRNQLHVQCTSRLSPWMAIGCLSPRTVFWRAEQWHSCKADGHLVNWNSRNLSWTHMLEYLEAFRALNHHFLPAPLFSPWRFCSIFDISIALCFCWHAISAIS